MGRPRIPFEERFFARVDKDTESGCWNWTGSCSWHWRDKTPTYGHTTLNGKRMGAHRASYIYHKGEIPEGLDVLHACDNTKCVNPDHLYLGTHADNMRDRITKGRANMLRGSKQPQAKLTEDDVRYIRKVYAEGGVTYKQLGAQFGVSSTSIYQVITRKFWKYTD